jgi:hypothetical protein
MTGDLEIILGVTPRMLRAVPGNAAWMAALADAWLTHRIGGAAGRMLRSAPQAGVHRVAGP